MSAAQGAAASEAVSAKVRALRRVDRAVIISDLHLTPNDPEGIDRFVALARKLPGAVQELFILGDLFEAYVGRKHLFVDGYRPVVRALDLLVSNGVAVTCLRGNRDFLLDEGFTKATGARVAGDEDTFVSGERRILAVHGDLFCVHDLRYQAMRAKLRRPWVRWASRTLPLPVLLRIAGGLRSKSRAEIAMKTTGEMGIVDAEVERRLAEGFDLVLCGHVHEPQSRRLGGGELVVLPAWPEPPGTLWLDRGALRFAPVG
ncbi:MAG: UDP-2,3-diacylglucosamine diphosphatase [Planctomycetes bacterium]|nr:UDP-2,3-diacylglucosamine diphosphatase [Planctomycetota bacterium]